MTDAELDGSIVRESNQIDAFGSKEFVRFLIDSEADLAIARMQFADLIAAAREELDYIFR